MSNTVVLLGFSTAGKSSLLEYFRKEYGEKIYYIDTDKLISAYHNGHIFNVYLDLFEQDDPEARRRPLDYIVKRENEILEKLSEPSNRPRIIAAGPFLHTRKENFEKFNTIVKPAYFFLKVTPENVYSGLLDRHVRIKKIVGDNPFFGCWDLYVTKRYNNDTRRYELLSEQDSLSKISSLLAGCQERYKELAGINVYDSIELRDENSNTRNKFFNDVSKILGF
jgi:shikimate kinase